MELIGDGGEGRVYKAVCIADGVNVVAKGELVALKHLRFTGDEKQSAFFQRQAEILRGLNHPNIVRYKDSFVTYDDPDKESYCIVTELLEGEVLKSLLQRHPTGLPWEQAREILTQTIQALQHVIKTGRGVIHRDLKPSNIFITRQGRVKLIDFGIARHGDGGITTTADAEIKGSFDYMAPDVVRLPDNFNGDERSEIFSFGVCCYEVLTGRLPFPALGGNTLISYASRWHAPQPPKVDFQNSAFRVLSHAVSTISKCLEVDRAARWPSFDVVGTEFSRIGRRKLQHGEEVYEYLALLGRGGFGEVYRARRKRDGYEVAIKRLLLDRQAKRFIREAKLLQNAAHPNLVKYVDFIEVRARETDSQFFLVLEYLPGMPGADLNQRIKNSEHGLEPAEALRLFICYLECLEHLHQHEIIHRDIKPSNLYAPVGASDQGKIFDLGIALDLEGTRTRGQVPGTLDYMPPEFATQGNERGSAQSDLYSLGVSLYLALTKTLPFPRLPEKEPQAWLAYYERTESPVACAFEPAVFQRHPELVGLLRRALAPEPKQRYGSAREMSEEVRLILSGVELQDLVGQLRERLPQQVDETTVGAMEEAVGAAVSGRARSWPGMTAGQVGTQFGALLEEARQRTGVYLQVGPGRQALEGLVEEPLDEFARRYPHLKTLCSREIEALRKTVRQQAATKAGAEAEPATTATYAAEAATIAPSADDLQRVEAELAEAEHERQAAAVKAEAKQRAAAARQAKSQKTGRQLAIAIIVGVSVAGLAVGGIYGWRLWEEKQLPRARAAAENLVRMPPEVFPLGDWRKQVKQAEIKTLVQGPNSSGWRRIADTLNAVEHQLPLAISNSFAAAISQKNATLAEELFQKWREAQSAGIKADDEDGMNLWMQAGLHVLWYPKLVLTTDPPGAEIFLQGVSLGTATVETNLAIGEAYHFSARHPLLGGVDKTIRLSVAGQPTNDVLRIPHGKLKLTSQPSKAAVVVNNELVGSTPFTPDLWPTGTVSFVISKGPIRETLMVAIHDDDAMETNVVLQLPRDQVQRLVKEVQIQQQFGVNLGNPKTCAADVSQRALTIANLLKDPQLPDLAQHPDVVAAQWEFWKSIAQGASKAYQDTHDWRFLSVARGAVWAALRLAPASTWSDVVTNLNFPRGPVDLEGCLPFPHTTDLQFAKVQNPFLASLSSNVWAASAGLNILPQALSARLSEGSKSPASLMVSLVLVPDGTGKVKTNSWSLKPPLYMAATETPFAAMSCFQSSGNEAAVRDPGCTNRFQFVPIPKRRNLQGAPSAPYEGANATEALSFCNWLSYTHHFESVYTLERGQWMWDRSKFGYRLPTAAEWEYAARYGFDFNGDGKRRTWQAIHASLGESLTQSHGPGLQDRKFIFFFGRESARLTDAQETEIYPLGLRDMCGNVAELCQIDREADNRVELVVCGGHYKSPSEEEVMPWNSKPYEKSFLAGAPIGFRIVLPVPVEEFTHE